MNMSIKVNYEEFICDECSTLNPAGEIYADEWGSYTILCDSCEEVYIESMSEENWDEDIDEYDLSEEDKF